MPSRVVLYSPDRAVLYDGRTPDHTGVGGGITARLSLLGALAAIGHDVTAYVNCRERIQHEGVTYVPAGELDAAGGAAIDTDVFIAISTGGDLSFVPLRHARVTARVRFLWVQGAPKPRDLDAVSADYVVVASRFLRDVCIERWGLPADRVAVCYNGLHQTRFEQAEGQLPPIARDPFALSYIGPPEKGLGAAIEVLRRLRAHDARYHLDVFGGGRLWGRETDGVPADPGVRSQGLVGQAALVPRLFEYEYCLAPQAMEEGFGIAVQEAKRGGQIVIASRVGAFGELMSDGDDGFLIDEPHTSAACHHRMAALVIELAANPTRRARVRRRAIASASTLSWAAAARAWTELFDAPPRRVLVGGYYGHGNLGDEAILGVMLAELRREMPSLQVTVASGDPARTSAVHRVDAVHERDLPALLAAAHGAAAVVLGGGGLLHDYFGLDEETMLSSRQWGLTLFAAYPLMAALRHRLFMLYGVGVGPLETEAGRRYTRMIVERASVATVRDATSRDALRALGATTESIHVSADPAFLLEAVPASAARTLLAEAGVEERPSRLIAVALRTWGHGADAGRWETSVAAALDRVVDARPATLLFVSCQASAEDDLTDDRAVAGRVRARMRHRAAGVIAPADFNPAETQRLFASSDLVIAMRLHGVILAANAGVPIVAIAYDPKVRAVMDQIGRGAQVIDLVSLTAAALADAVMGAERDQMATAGQQPATIAALRAAARISTTRLVDLLRNGPHELPAASPEWTAFVAEALAARTWHARINSSLRRAARVVRRRLVVPPLKRLRDSIPRRLKSAPVRVFDRYKRARKAVYGRDLGGLRAPGEPGLVSIVLPVHNGAAFVREAIDSVLAQTYTNVELIIVDDGSTDDTATIVDAYATDTASAAGHIAGRRAHVRVVHQEHRQLPAALSRGFRMARGEFLTWTSADNRLKPRFLETLVARLERHPAWDMVYANLDVIGEDGTFWRNSPHYEGYQRPHGSEHVALPPTTAELNVVANNSVGAAFLYRSRVPFLIGDYSRHRFVMEDYDYWMRVNALMTIRHTGVAEPLYDYRFHGRSLTSRWEEFDMLGRRERLMVFDDFRRDVFLQPMVWMIDGPASTLAAALEARVRAAGHLMQVGPFAPDDVPAASVPVVYARVTTDPLRETPPAALTAATLKVLVAGTSDLPDRVHAAWDVCVAVGPVGVLPRLAGDYQGWLAAADMATLFQAIDARAKSAHLERFEDRMESPVAPSVPATRASVVICTRRWSERLAATLRAVADQQFTRPYEVIVVDNSDRGVEEFPTSLPGRVVRCPVRGVSAARNAGLAEARGELVCFLDDDALPAPDWLAWVCRAFDEHPSAAVVGGHVRLKLPAIVPRAVRPRWRKYWSEYMTDDTTCKEVDTWAELPRGANWSARCEALRAVGGFRSRYGRTGDDYWGGEEMVAACLMQRLGGAIAVEPRAVVLHDVEPGRFTLEHVVRTAVAGLRVNRRAKRDLYVKQTSEIFLENDPVGHFFGRRPPLAGPNSLGQSGVGQPKK